MATSRSESTLQGMAWTIGIASSEATGRGSTSSTVNALGGFFSTVSSLIVILCNEKGGFRSNLFQPRTFNEITSKEEPEKIVGRFMGQYGVLIVKSMIAFT